MAGIAARVGEDRRGACARSPPRSAARPANAPPSTPAASPGARAKGFTPCPCDSKQPITDRDVARVLHTATGRQSCPRRAGEHRPARSEARDPVRSPRRPTTTRCWPPSRTRSSGHRPDRSAGDRAVGEVDRRPAHRVVGRPRRGPGDRVVAYPACSGSSPTGCRSRTSSGSPTRRSSSARCSASTACGTGTTRPISWRRCCATASWTPCAPGRRSRRQAARPPRLRISSPLDLVRSVWPSSDWRSITDVLSHRPQPKQPLLPAEQAAGGRSGRRDYVGEKAALSRAADAATASLRAPAHV